ncbi:tripartite tricarboxylate transporter substrate binding protein BugE [Cupriavidus campinensis]|uniref:tripartite tricarboxylate transporter substrate binding protein BugE n=1 Tax=Cupriavidus campinensis TaxID=151783 RepID=UPI003D6AD7B7
MKKNTKAKTVVVALASGLAMSSALAQSYPSRPIKLQVPFAAGGTTDLVARIVADPLGKLLGQPVVVENKPGGGGSVSAAEVARAQPDGYTIGLANVATTAANPAINPRTPYNPLTDFAPIVNIAATPNVIVVNPGFPAHDYKGFVAELKANPAKYSYASAGAGGIAHLQTELFKSLTGVYMTHIPYRGSAPALTDTMGGQVPIMFDNLPSALPFIRSKKLIPIVVAAPQRLPELPHVPTFKEVGLEPVNRMAYYGLWAPRGVPKDIVDKLNAGVRQVLSDPAVRQRIQDANSLVIGNTPEEFANQIKAEYAVYRKVVQTQKLSLD